MADMPTVRARTEPADPLMRRYREVNAEIRRLRGELRDLKQQMLTGVCEVCGARFTRQRPTKRYCSNACVISAYNARTIEGAANMALIREMWPLVKASGQLTPRNIVLVQEVVLGRMSGSSASDHFSVSRQRIDQVLSRAAKVAKLVKTMRVALAAEEHRAEATHG
jgi:hypothetical protein